MNIKNKTSLLLTALALCTIAIGCTPSKKKSSNREGIDPSSKVKASTVIGDSFTLTTENQSSYNRNFSFSILKSALGKEFLLSANILSQAPTPSFSNLQSRVVSFIKRNSKLYMLDVTGNNVVGVDNIPQNLLLAEFDITKETTTGLEFDFNKGMSDIVQSGDMIASDFDKKDPNSFKLSNLKIKSSFLNEVSFKDQALFIKQVVQVETQDEKGATELTPHEVRYQIKPYNPNKNFIPTTWPGLDKVGYFEANPLLLENGSTKKYALKFDTTKTIEFYISANTPAKYRDVIKNGLLYWNKIMGDNFIKVIQLEDKTITAPQFDKNIIQWADYDTAGFAFADTHADPRSGEITSSQIMLTSVFLINEGPRRLRVLENMKPNTPKLGLKGFKSSRLCQRNISQELAKFESSIADISPEIQEKMLFGYVEETVAHELGHVLGLRHNFAGNLEASYDLRERKQILLNFYKTQTLPSNYVNSSSVMEYSLFEESGINGINSIDNKPALTYDTVAIEHLYKNKTLSEFETIPAFCTDSHMSKYADCNQFDAGKSIVTTTRQMFDSMVSRIPQRVIESYISKSKSQEALGTGQNTPVEKVSISVSTLSEDAAVHYAKLISLLKEKTAFIGVRSSYLPIAEQNVDEIITLEDQFLTKEINAAGGLKELTKLVDTSLTQKLIERFNTLIETPYYKSGVLYNNTSYSFSVKEIEIMKQQFAKVAPKITENLILLQTQYLSGKETDMSEEYGQTSFDEENPLKWNQFSITEELPSVQLDLMKSLLTSKVENSSFKTKLTNKTGDSEVELPVFSFPFKIRKAATQLLSNESSTLIWGYAEKKDKETILEDILKPLGEEPELKSLTPEALNWYLENKKLMTLLSE